MGKIFDFEEMEKNRIEFENKQSIKDILEELENLESIRDNPFAFYQNQFLRDKHKVNLAPLGITKKECLHRTKNIEKENGFFLVTCVSCGKLLKAGHKGHKKNKWYRNI